VNLTGSGRLRRLFADVAELYEKRLPEIQKTYFERISWPTDAEVELIFREGSFVEHSLRCVSLILVGFSCPVFHCTLSEKATSILYRLSKHASQLNRHPTLAVYVDAWDNFKTFFAAVAGTVFRVPPRLHV
jgi:hypothetical protein